MQRLALTFTACLLAAQVYGSPPEAVAAALRHAQTLAADTDRQLRYLDLSHLPNDRLLDAYRAISFHLNALSRESDIVRPLSLEGGKLLAIDLRDYGIDRLTYGKLATVDPYFHILLDVTTQGKTTRQAAHAPWVKPQIDELATMLNSFTPILRGDFFVYQTAIQRERVAGYYDMLGLGKKEADFLRLIGANPAESRRLKLEMAASIAQSTVALHNRGITRQQAMTGGHWQTLDFRTSTNKQNTARLLAGDTEPPRGDAGEHFGVLPNGLFAYWLQDAKGDRQDSVPDDLASDGRSTSTDRRVHPMLSCVRCHQPGLNEINDFARRLFSGPVALVSPDYEKLKRLRQLYLSDLPGQLTEDNLRFAKGVALCNNLSPVENSRLYGQFWEAYADTPIYPVQAARDVGCTEAHLLARVKEYVARGGIVDPVVASYAQTVPLPIRRDHYEEVYSVLQTLAGGQP